MSVRDRMMHMIRSGEYPVGGRLPPERELAERFDVSRPTIREAIIALETLGMVQVKTGSGVYVLKRTGDGRDRYEHVSAFELTETRALVEGEAAALAAKMITDEELEVLEQTLVDMAEENATGDLAAGDADRDFHQVIAKATRNRMIEELIDELWFVRNNVPHVFKAYQAICEMDGARRVEEHTEIFDALKNRDEAAARRAMHHHFARILNKLIATTEEEQVREVRRRTSEVRKRFSLDHLVGT
ncbi:MAG: FadR/GntR family transcriptional regulator [Xanthomonadales bacterium]|nr:FadR/GntR family transcriptional regulator [Xanthomonadales bacterium]